VDTHIVERLAEFINNGELKSEMIHAESEHSAISAALGAEATGIRTFTATASQGLALMHEILFVVAGMRMPVVMAVANRALSAPINIWNDHQDSFSQRDSGWIQLYVESAQEALDTVIQAYKIAENHDILLPAMVCLDGFTLSHVFEPVDIPKQKEVNKFLPKYNPFFKLDPKNPLTLGPIGFPNTYMEFRQDTQKAMINSLSVIKKTHDEFKKSFKRYYGNGLIEKYKIDDAESAVVAMGTICGTARVVVDEMRKEGKKVGLIKIKCFRPFPKEEITNCCKNIKNMAVIDRNISLGNEGALFTEFKSAFYNQKNKPVINGFIAGLGGRDVTKEHIKKAFERIGKTNQTEWLN
jgi:pyruvate ferredoxin oxidoreductase alpha subunit